ncbi:tripartite tricarboxylate transporter substrate binding protein [Paralcaligenes sp. KSB-10]|jgi:tripartite-type tricarboxylate transporter receptor subunit TctC|uniref:Bug family tripartite tricarboxylate transporter substrate binding protein n=1 Tax=Paralcaligenes sp. KSB-10 TaxID=2901142 RepID=UPI001E4E1651|nr:tripartite tricarboxylate transporter substrate binding protein [Paralcaligenes sp. KSB-10]UHL63766.1 tripartite tricarboxylate transporter substrate binding protein [Paralcaligenes sp. KSB-10]
MKKMHIWLAGMLLACAGMAQAAQPYPNHAIHMFLPWPPGGGVDTMGRFIADPLAQRLGQAVIVDNRAGAGGNIGTAMAARAEPDGYNLLMGSISPNAVNKYLYSNLGFDPIKDFDPIVFVSSVPNILVVPASSPFKTMQDVVAYAKANPDKLNYGSGGVGSSQHLAAVQFMAAAKIKMVHVPYKGTSPAEAGLMASQISLMLDTTTCLPLISSGKLRALAVASKDRNPALPNVPTFKELGLPIYASSWYGLMAPAGTPRPIIERINHEVNDMLKTDQKLRARMADYGAEMGGGTPEDFGAFIASEMKRYKTIVELSGAKLD